MRLSKWLNLFTLALIFLVVYGVWSPANAQPSFQGLGDLSGGQFSSSAYDVSADGSVVVGRGLSGSGHEAFRWTETGGMVGLGDLPGGNFLSFGLGVSADGNVVVGFGSTVTTEGTYNEEAFLWSETDGMVGLGFLPGGKPSSRALAVSEDGAVVAGWGLKIQYEASRWTESTGMVPLNSDVYGSAQDVSPSGSVIVGQANLTGDSQAFRWTESTGMVGLGDLDGGSFGSIAHGVSSDGSVIVGQGTSGLGKEAFRWTEASGTMVGLGAFLTGDDYWSEAYAVSGDGSIAVGRSKTSTYRYEAFIWDEINGMRKLAVVLADEYDLDLTGWTLEEAYSISADGLTIVGTGKNPSGQTEAWRASLVPLPGSLLLLGSGLLGLGLLGLRRKLS